MKFYNENKIKIEKDIFDIEILYLSIDDENKIIIKIKLYF